MCPWTKDDTRVRQQPGNSGAVDVRIAQSTKEDHDQEIDSGNEGDDELLKTLPTPTNGGGDTDKGNCSGGNKRKGNNKGVDGGKGKGKDTSHKRKSPRQAKKDDKASAKAAAKAVATSPKQGQTRKRARGKTTDDKGPTVMKKPAGRVAISKKPAFGQK